MATIKSLLEKAMLRLGSRGGRSSGEVVNMTVNQSGSEFQWFTAPTDGTYSVEALATDDNAFVWMSDGSSNSWSCRALFANGSIAFSFPVKKGASAGIQWTESMTNRALKFVKSIGGSS